MLLNCAMLCKAIKKAVNFNLSYVMGITLVITISLFSYPTFAKELSKNQKDNHQTEQKSKNKRASKKVPAMRNRVYTQLARAQKLADDGDKIAGFEVLDEVKDKIDSLNSYEKAMLWNFYGFMYYSNDDMENAIDSFKNVVAEQAIPQSLYLSTLYSLAQLAMQQQHYQQALGFLTQWQINNPKELTGDQQVLFAQVFYQDKKYQQSLTYLTRAIAAFEEKKVIPKENWLILQRAIYFELKQPKNVTKVLEKLVRLYDKPQYWLQLSGMYGEINEEDKQLAVLEAAYQAGYVTKGNDITSLAQLYLFNGAPYKSAALLDKAIAKGLVKPEQKYLNLLAQSYLVAKEPNKAIPVFKQLSKIVDSGKFDAQLAQTYLNDEKWQLAIDSANKALERGGITKTGTMHLVKGMAYFNVQKFDLAINAFNQAEKIASSKKMAQQWRKYVEREQGYQTRLAQVKSKTNSKISTEM